MADRDESIGKIFAIDYEIAEQTETFISLWFDHVDAHPIGQLCS